MHTESSSLSPLEELLHEEYIEHWLQRAESLLSEERPEAIHAIEKILSLVENSPKISVERQLRVHHQVSRAFGFLGRTEEALEHALRVRASLRQQPPQKLTFENHYILGRLYNRRGEYSRGLRHLYEYFEYQQEQQDIFGQYKALIFIAENYTGLGEWDKAIEMHLECSRLSEFLEGEDYRFDSLNNLCDLYTLKGDYGRAEEIAPELEGGLLTVESVHLKSTLLSTLLELRVRQERWSEAEQLAEQMKEINENEDSSSFFRSKIDSWRNIGVLAFEKGDFHEALEYLEKSYLQAVEKQEYVLQLRASPHLIKAHQALGQTKKALAMTKVRLELLERQQNHRMTQIRQKAEVQYQARLLQAQHKIHLEEQKQQMQSLQQLQAVRDDVLEHLLHDLNSPLHSIQREIEVLEKEGCFVGESGAFYGDEMQKQVQRLLLLNQNLLNLTQLETHPLHKEEISVSTLLFSLVQEQLPHAQALSQSLNVDNQLLTECTVFADRALLVTALQNLLSNAIKYTQPGGRVVVRAYRQRELLCLEVEDNGPGIEEKNHSRIFERFFRCGQHKTGVEGTGLGLSIVQSTMNQHNGRVEVESELGKGSCFRLLLPLEEALCE